jgi:hypothetical protein
MSGLLRSHHARPHTKFLTAPLPFKHHAARRHHPAALVGRYKAAIGPRLCARTGLGQQGEVALAVEVLNRMMIVPRGVV